MFICEHRLVLDSHIPISRFQTHIHIKHILYETELKWLFISIFIAAFNTAMGYINTQDQVQEVLDFITHL